MGKLTFAQAMHILVTLLAAIVWVGISIWGYTVGADHQAAFQSSFGDILMLAKTTTVSGIGVAVAMTDFKSQPQSDITAAAPGEALPKQ